MVMLIRRYVADKGKKVIEPIQVSAIHNGIARSRITSLLSSRRTSDSRGCEISVKDVHAIYKDWCRSTWQEMKPDQMMTMVTS
jgi:hypothetical protein